MIKVTIQGINYWVKTACLKLDDDATVTFSTNFTEKQKNKYSHETREKLQ